MRPEKPATQKETIDQMWFVLIGANSEGIAERVRRIDDRLQAVEEKIPYLMTHAQHKEYAQACSDHERDTEDLERRKKWRTTDVILAVGMLVVTTASIAGAFI